LQGSEENQTVSPAVKQDTGVSGLDALLGVGYNQGWIILVLGELEAAASSGMITPEERNAIGSATIGLHDLAGPRLQAR